MLRTLLTLACITLGLLVLPPVASGEERQTVVRVRLADEPISPVTARFVQRGIREAESTAAECLLIELDTPGGLLQATRDMVRGILGANVPVIVYVSPSGARAASAGLFITLASDIAAMAPATHIGAAHPVQVGSLPISQREKEEGEGGGVMEDKIVNDTRAWARALAQRRNRNTDWVERAVDQSQSLTASEAVENKVVELLVADTEALLQALDGRVIPRLAGRTLHTAGAEIVDLEMGLGQRILSILAHPNVAFLLLIVGFYGIIFELYSPGWGVAGTLGIACLLLGAVGFAFLPLSYAGLSLVIVALAMFVAEAFVVSFGLLTIGGIACLVLGGFMLVDSPEGFMRVSLQVIIPIAVATGLISLFLLGSAVRAMRTRASTGAEALVHSEAVAQDPFTWQEGLYRGTVRVHGEFWRAESEKPVLADEHVEVVDLHGLTLRVEAPEHTAPESTGEAPRA